MAEAPKKDPPHTVEEIGSVEWPEMGWVVGLIGVGLVIAVILGIVFVMRR